MEGTSNLREDVYSNILNDAHWAATTDNGEDTLETSDADEGTNRQHRNIMIPIDGSDHSERAFLWYLENVSRSTDHLCFVHVVEPDLALSVSRSVCNDHQRSTVNTEDLGRILEDHIFNGKKIGQSFLIKANQRKLRSKAFLLIHAKAGPVIVKAAKNHGADLIVMGCRGMSTLLRTIMGSVSDYVLHHSDIPVLSVPPT